MLILAPIEEEGHTQPLLGQGHSGGHGNGNALIGGAVEDGLLFAQLVKVGLGVEFAEPCDLLTGLDVTGVDEVGNLPAGLGGEVAEFQHTCPFQKLYKLSFIGFHVHISLIFKCNE